MQSPAAGASPVRALDLHAYRTRNDDDADELVSRPSSPGVPSCHRDFSDELATPSAPATAAPDDDEDDDLISQMSSLKVADDSRPPSSAFTRSARTSVSASPTKGNHGMVRDESAQMSGRREVAQFSLLDPRSEAKSAAPPKYATATTAPPPASRPDSPLMLMDEEEEDLFGIADSTFPDEELPPISIESVSASAPDLRAVGFGEQRNCGPPLGSNYAGGFQSDGHNDALANALATPLPPSPAVVNSQPSPAQAQAFGTSMPTNAANDFGSLNSAATPTRPSVSGPPLRSQPMQFSLDVTGLPPSGRATPVTRARESFTPQTNASQPPHTPRAVPFKAESHSPLQAQPQHQQQQKQQLQWLHAANVPSPDAATPSPRPSTIAPAAPTFQFRAARSAPNLTSGRSPGAALRSTAGHTPRKAPPHAAGSGAGARGQNLSRGARTRPGAAKPVKLPYNRDVTITVPLNADPKSQLYASPPPHATTPTTPSPSSSSLSSSSKLPSTLATRLPTPSPIKELRSHAKRELDAAAAAEGPGIAKFSRGPSKLPLAAGISRIPARIPRPAPRASLSSLSAPTSSHNLTQPAQRSTVAPLLTRRRNIR
ncbi:hypothetical protein HDU90_001686 [Geranomyces variabilis]|nr:hypothetical protein HDU90_001686 [Geranomyces variabilis]